MYIPVFGLLSSFNSEIWARQGLSAILVPVEGIQLRAIKFILQDYESSYVDRLKKLPLIPVFISCKISYSLITNVYPPLTSLASTSTLLIFSNPPLVLALVIFVQTCAKHHFSETHTLTKLYFYGAIYPQISNHFLRM